MRPIRLRQARPESLFAFRISSSRFRALPVPFSSTQAAPMRLRQAVPPFNTAAKLNVNFLRRVPLQSFNKRLQHNINLRSHYGCFVWVVARRLQQFERTVAMSMARPWGLSKRNGYKE